MHYLNAVFVFLFVTILTLSACDDGGQRAQNVSTNPAVEARATTLLEAIQRGNDELIIKQYSEDFFTKRSPQQWLAKLKALMAERGPMRSFALKRSQADTRFSGKFYILEYNSVHDGAKRLHHTLTFLLPVDGGDIELNGHKIVPWEAKAE
ncbi:MAG TPA: hypothetical protein ENJ17_04260 [Gammaproteobacteria bacterium]|nr:hypothetical protein [Gammaproteobacteria bacterium]